MSTDERVLVIPTERFHAAGYFSGFRPFDEAHAALLLDPAGFQFRSRAEVETDPAFKQLIPYIVLQYADELFHYRRGSSGREKRLQSLRSIGLGGHISAADAVGATDAYRAGMLRELTEEVDIRCAYSECCLGFINDDRTLVGRVHLGVVHLCRLTAPTVFPREEVIAAAGFAHLSSLRNSYTEFETWSQFTLDYLSGFDFRTS